MPPKKPAPRSDELFRSQLDNMVDMEHALVKLAGLINWSRFDAAYGRFYHEKGRPGLSTRLMAGLHAPEVECIAKGKARTRYEFGVKSSIAVTNARTAGGQFIVGMQALPGSPYDGHTLSGQIEQVERLTGEVVPEIRTGC